MWWMFDDIFGSWPLAYRNDIEEIKVGDQFISRGRKQNIFVACFGLHFIFSECGRLTLILQTSSLIFQEVNCRDSELKYKAVLFELIAIIKINYSNFLSKILFLSSHPHIVNECPTIYLNYHNFHII